MTISTRSVANKLFINITDNKQTLFQLFYGKVVRSRTLTMVGRCGQCLQAQAVTGQPCPC